MAPTIRVAVVIALLLPSFGTLSYARGGGEGKSTAEKCHMLLMKWRGADHSHHMAKVLNARDKAEKKMKKLGCPPPETA
jgi:hypothetical protein